jgi:2-polyprenyl-3-methyl-5-hydroxy-6-metoxy-1,4-benzoquinol methylase
MIEYKNFEDIKRLNFISSQIKTQIPTNGKILDVGCGNGNISLYLGSLNYDVKGIDVSDESIRYAQNRNALPNVKFQCISAEELTINEERFDAIVCSEVLEHLEKPEVLLKTLAQLLKANGIILITVPNGFGPREVLITKPMQWLTKKNNWLTKSILKLKHVLGYSGTTLQSSNEDLTHIQFFSWQAIQKICLQNALELKEANKANFVEAVFPFSLFTRHSRVLQKLDCKIADTLPITWVSGFYTVWQKKAN